MTDDNKFFRFVWRFNGIVILLVLLGGLVCGGFHVASRHGLIHWKWHDAKLIHMGTDFHPTQSYVLTPLDAGSAGAKTESLYALNRFSQGIPTTEFTPFVPGDTATVNILSVDEKSKTSHWLFEQGERRILSQTELYDYGKPTGRENDEVPAPVKVAGFALLVVESDTNKDGKITAKDAQVLYIYRMDGKAPVKVLAADRIIVSAPAYGADRLDLFYQSGGKSFAASYSLPKLEPQSLIPISNLPELKAGYAPMGGNLESIVLTGGGDDD